MGCQNQDDLFLFISLPDPAIRCDDLTIIVMIRNRWGRSIRKYVNERLHTLAYQQLRHHVAICDPVVRLVRRDCDLGSHREGRLAEDNRPFPASGHRGL